MALFCVSLFAVEVESHFLQLHLRMLFFSDTAVESDAKFCWIACDINMQI